MSKKYHQLNQEQRHQIAALKKAGHTNGFIARQLKIHKSTISRELVRNSSSKGTYNPCNAQTYTIDRKADKPKPARFTAAMKLMVNDKLQNEQWSPEQISGWCKANSIPMASYETIYQYIYSDMKKGGCLYTHLRTKHKRRKNRTHRKGKRGTIPGRVPISERPEIVNLKQRVGDWEIDLIEGVNHTSFALTAVEKNRSSPLL